MKSFKFWLILSILTIVIAYWRWFFTSDIYAWGDWGFHWPEIVKGWFGFPQIWLREFMGRPDAGLPLFISTRFFYSTLAHFLPFVGYDRLVFLIPSVLIPSISVYLLVYQKTKSPIASFTGSVVYSFNSYILLLNTGHLTISTAYALGPIVFLLFRGAIRRASLKYSIGAALAGIICAAYEIRGFLLVSWILLFYLLFSFPKLKHRARACLLALTTFAIIIASNLYWVLGYVQTSETYEGVSILRQLAGGYTHILPRAFLLASPWWTATGEQAWGRIQTITPYFWVIPFLALLGYWINRHDHDTNFWMIIALIGIFLVKMQGNPFGELYPWLFNHLPGFQFFRDSSKFNYLISLSYAVLIGQLVQVILNNHKLKINFKLLLITAIIGTFLYNGKPLIMGNLGKLMTPRRIPNDYLIFKDFLLSQPEHSKTLYVPSYTKWGPRDANHRMVSMYEQVKGEWSSLYPYNKTGLEYDPLEHITSPFQKSFTNDLLDYASIKYVVVALEDKENEEVFLYPTETTRQQFIDILSNTDYLKKIDIGTNDLVVFENPNARQLFMIESNPNYTVNCQNATTCTFKFPQALNSSKLYFSDSFHTGWKLRVGDFNWWGGLMEKDYFLPDSLHHETEYGLNYFNLPPLEAGSRLTLYFHPQSLVNIGTIIGIATIGISLIILIRVWVIQK